MKAKLQYVSTPHTRALLLVCCIALSPGCLPAAEESVLQQGPTPKPSYAADFNNTEVDVQSGFTDDLQPVRLRRPALEGSPLQFTYAVECPDFLGCDTFLSEVSLAFQAWEQPHELEFSPAQWGVADIHISFEEGTHQHECDTGYTDRSTTLAHTLTKDCPTGLIHLNSDLQWSFVGTRQSESGAIRYDVRTVLIHEVGHLLGLGHAPSDLDIMHLKYVGSKRHVPDSVRLQGLRRVRSTN